MKKHILLALMLLGSFISCQEEEMQQQNAPAATLSASIENLGNTPIYWTYGSELIHWIGTDVTRYSLGSSSAGDCSGVFNNMGKVEDAFVSSVPLKDAVAAFPFNKDIKCAIGKNNIYKLTDVVLADNITYGDAPFTAVAVTDHSDSLELMHVCGAIELLVTGHGTVKSIQITGNEKEPLSGECEIHISKNGAPEVSMAENSATGITINCGSKGIKLDSKKASRFQIPLPPGTYSQGLTFSFKFNGDEDDIEKVIDKSITIRRATVYECPVSLTEDYDDSEDEEVFIPETNPNELINLVAIDYDGFTVQLNMPSSVSGEEGPGTNAIRWNHCDLMTFNFNNQPDDYTTLLDRKSNYTTADPKLVYSGDNMSPIFPGEPIIFVAGEFSWMTDADETPYFNYDEEWDNGYYKPVLNPDYFTNGKYQPTGTLGVDYTHPMDAYWTGAFERKFFRTKLPSVFDAEVRVDIPDDSRTNPIVELYPEDGVHQYYVGLFDESGYQEFLSLINYNPDYLQWAVTSYFAFYNFGTSSHNDAIALFIPDFFENFDPNSTYHLLITSMGDPEGTAQNFQHITFELKESTLPEPEISVTPAVHEITPYAAAFNIRCTSFRDNPLKQAYFAAAYIRDWTDAINSGYTYYDRVNGNYAFSESELMMINSEDGYTISFPSLDGETTRLAVLGYNSEYTPNDIQKYNADNILDCTAVADVTTPWLPAKSHIDPIHYEDLIGTWTATAILQHGTDSHQTYEYSSKITISDNAGYYPQELPQDVYDIYKANTKLTESEVKAYWEDFKQMAEIFTTNRLANQNRLLCTGWIDDDSHGRLTTRTPYDLFVAMDYSSVDAASIYNDFGPKWYIEAVEDKKTGEISLVVPVDAYFLPPAANRSMPFYMAAMHPVFNHAFISPSEGGVLNFPVEYDAEKDEITIKPFIFDGEEYYPNIIGIDSQTGGSILENPVVSEVVLTRGWDVATSIRSSKSRSAAKNTRVIGEFPNTVYKERTRLK